MIELSKIGGVAEIVTYGGRRVLTEYQVDSYIEWFKKNHKNTPETVLKMDISRIIPGINDIELLCKFMSYFIDNLYFYPVTMLGGYYGGIYNYESSLNYSMVLCQYKGDPHKRDLAVIAILIYCDDYYYSRTLKNVTNELFRVGLINDYIIDEVLNYYMSSKDLKIVEILYSFEDRLDIEKILTILGRHYRAPLSEQMLDEKMMGVLKRRTKELTINTYRLLKCLDIKFNLKYNNDVIEHIYSVREIIELFCNKKIGVGKYRYLLRKIFTTILSKLMMRSMVNENYTDISVVCQ